MQPRRLPFPGTYGDRNRSAYCLPTSAATVDAAARSYHSWNTGGRPAGWGGGPSDFRQTGPISGDGMGVVAGVGELFLKYALPAGVIGAHAASAAAGAARELVRADRFLSHDGLGPIARAPHWLSDAGQQSLDSLRIAKLHGLPFSCKYPIYYLV